MTENLKVSITTAQRDASFIMTFDPNFPPDRDMRISIERDGGCEQEVVHLMMRVLKPGDVCVDGGANVGYFTCLMSQLVGPSGLVFAVEPAPANIAKLEHNLANNTTKNVRIVKSPLYGDVREVTMHLAHHSGFSALVPNAYTSGKMTMVSTTIDAMLDGQLPKLIKLDIEGAEGFAIRGAQDALAYKPYVVMEMNEQALRQFDTDRNDMRRAMKVRGFDCYVLQKDGIFPLQVPLETEIICERENLMVLFATPDKVAAAWPVLELT